MARPSHPLRHSIQLDVGGVGDPSDWFWTNLHPPCDHKKRTQITSFFEETCRARMLSFLFPPVDRVIFKVNISLTEFQKIRRRSGLLNNQQDIYIRTGGGNHRSGQLEEWREFFRRLSVDEQVNWLTDCTRLYTKNGRRLFIFSSIPWLLRSC